MFNLPLFWKTYKNTLVLGLLGLSLYAVFAYALVRTEFVKLLLLWFGLFGVAYGLIRQKNNPSSVLLGLGLLFRFIFWGALPNLSQDFYRFIWDGRMLLAGFNPYLYLPEQILSQGSAPIAQAQELYTGMGKLNGSHYTNYPPVSQLCYAIAAGLGGKSILGFVMVLRLLVILADLGIFYWGRKVLKSLKLPDKRIFWYFLNPFVIIELTGNLHLEAIMLFFVVLAIYFLQKQFWYRAGLCLALGVSVKLIPLLFLPLFFQHFISPKQPKLTIRIIKLLAFYLMILVATALLFVPFISYTFLDNFGQTLGLWFQHFEFNASIYYLIRWLGYQIVGWNIIGTVGKILPLITIAILLGLTFFRKNKTPQQWITAMLLGICCHYFLSTTVHPWYIAVPVLLSLFTRYQFALLWSLVIVFSYAAYGQPDYKENLWMVGLEYSFVLGYLGYEIFYPQKKMSLRLLP